MKAALLLLLLIPTTCDAGRARARKSLDLRAARIQSGVTLTRAKTAYYRARTAANISGLLNPAGWIIGVLF